MFSAFSSAFILGFHHLTLPYYDISMLTLSLPGDISIGIGVMKKVKDIIFKECSFILLEKFPT